MKTENLTPDLGTRDDLNHNVYLLSMNVERDEKHAKRYPVGLFTDEMWAKAMPRLGIDRLKIDKKKLLLAIRVVEEFCAWIDGIRCNYPKYIKALNADPQRAD